MDEEITFRSAVKQKNNSRIFGNFCIIPYYFEKNWKNGVFGPIWEKPEILGSGCKLSQIDIKVSAKFPGQVFSVVQISAVFTKQKVFDEEGNELS